MSYPSDRHFRSEQFPEADPGLQAISKHVDLCGGEEMQHQSHHTIQEDHAQLSPRQALRARLGLDMPLRKQDLSLATLLSEATGAPWPTRVAAVRALALFGKGASEEVRRTLVAALYDEEEAVRVVAARALGKLEEQAPRTHLLLALRDRSEFVRAAAVSALGKLGPRLPLEAIIGHLRGDEAPVVRVAAARALGRLRQPELLPYLRRTLQDGDPFVRQTIVRILREQTEENVPLRTLMRALKDQDEEVRLEALTALGTDTPIGVLQTALIDKSEAVRLEALRLLSERGGQIPLEAVLSLLQDDSEQVREAASKLLGDFYLQLPQKIPPNVFLQLLQGKNPDHLRMMAAWALGERKEPEAREALHQALSDSSTDVQVAVRWALQELGESVSTSVFGPTQLQVERGNLLSGPPFSEGCGSDTPSLLTCFLLKVAGYLEDKQGYIEKAIWQTPQGPTLVLFCGYQQTTQSLQEMVLASTRQQAPVQDFRAALTSEDATIQKVARQVTCHIASCLWQEALLTCLELLHTEEVREQKEIPRRVIFCSVAFVEPRRAGTHILQREGPGEYSRKQDVGGCVQGEPGEASSLCNRSLSNAPSATLLENAVKYYKYWSGCACEQVGMTLFSSQSSMPGACPSQ